MIHGCPDCAPGMPCPKCDGFFRTIAEEPQPPLSATRIARESEALKEHSHIPSLAHQERVEQLDGSELRKALRWIDGHVGRDDSPAWAVHRISVVQAINWLDLAVRAASLSPRGEAQQGEEKEDSAGLIGQTIPDMEGTEPRLNSEEREMLERDLRTAKQFAKSNADDVDGPYWAMKAKVYQLALNALTAGRGGSK